MWTSAEESFDLSQCSRQAETTSTRPAVIDTTRQRQNRQDHEDGHRYCGGNTRQAIDKLGPVELVRRPTHSTGHVPTEYRRPATIHQKQPPKLHLTSKRRTTKVFPKTIEFHIFFLPFAGGAKTGGAQAYKRKTPTFSLWTIFELKHYTRCTGDNT